MQLLAIIIAIVDSPVTGVVLGIASISLAFYLDRRNRSVRRLSYRVASVELREWGTVSGQEVTGLTVALWNAGTLEIRRGDLSALEPITVRAPDGPRIIQASVRTMSRPANNVHVSPCGAIGVYLESVNIHFDYLNPNDGAVLDIVYVGPHDATISVDGALIGIGSPTPLVYGGLLGLLVVFMISQLLWIFSIGIWATGQVWPASVLFAAGALLYPLYVFIHFSRRQRLIPTNLAQAIIPPPSLVVPPVKERQSS